MADLKRYNITIDDKHQGFKDDVGFSAETTLKLVEQGLRDGASRIFVVEVGKGLLTNHPGRE